MREVIIKDQAVKSYPKGKLVFTYLPKYAAFIRDNCLIPYIKEQVSICRTIDLPMMKFLEGITDEQLVEMGVESHRLFLTSAENNTLDEHLEESLKKWVSDQLVIMKKEDLTAEDISYAGFVRKRSLLKFLSSYTSDLNEAIAIISEIDELNVHNDIAATNVYIKLLKDRISEQAFFTEILSKTTPGLNYIFDLNARTVKYANTNTINFFGNSLEEMERMGSAIIHDKVHPDDLQLTIDSLGQCATAADGAVVSWEFRLKNAEAGYLWMRNYTSPYKRESNGLVTEIVGIILNIDEEKEISDKLLLSERQLLDAQEQAGVGSYEMDSETGNLDATPQLLKILGIQPRTDVNGKVLFDNVHPDDRDRLIDVREQALLGNGTFDVEYRYLAGGKEKALWSRGRVVVKNGKKIWAGTVMDVTARYDMVRRLQESEGRFKQAQELSHIGNWSWDLVSGKIEWSDELYRIYGRKLGSEITFDKIMMLNHPDDRVSIKQDLQDCIETGQPLETYYRALLKDGTQKILFAKTEALRDKTGKPCKLIGTIQDVTEKQLMLDQLQENDRLFKQAQARTHIGNWTWDIASDKVTWSDEMFRVYGLKPQSEEVNYETYLAHIHPDDVEARKAQVQHVFETGEPEERHYRIIIPTGEVRILHTKSELQYDKDGKPARMTGTCQDVTEKQTLINRLQHSDALYKQAQAISHIGNWSFDMATKKLDWSDELYRIYELAPDTAVDIGTTVLQYIHRHDEALMRDTIKRSLETLEPFDFNYRIALPGGRIKTLNARGGIETGSDMRPVKIYGTVQDITRQKDVEKQLKDSQEFIQKVTDVTPSIISAYNVHTGQFSFINGAIEKQLGYTQSEVMKEGVPFFVSVTHPDDLPAIMEKNAKSLEEANLQPADSEEPIMESKYRMKNRDGEYRWFHTFGTIFERNEKGLVESILNISIDVTEQEEAEQAVYQKNLQLQQSNTSLEEYAYVASHDLKEPLRKIVTFSDRILTTQGETLREDGRVFLGKIIDSSRRMQKMINDLLYVSTIAGNKVYQESDLNFILSEALQPLDQKIEELKAIIECGTLPVVPVVPAQFIQMFQNLLGNSLKFVRKGVTPTIKITHSFLNSRAVEGLDLVKAKKYLKIELQDNGIGFDNQYASKIFSIFQRLHGKAEYEGTGIGLAVCKRIIENHGGTIFAEGKVNEGATFTVIFPV